MLKHLNFQWVRSGVVSACTLWEWTITFLLWPRL